MDEAQTNRFGPGLIAAAAFILLLVGMSVARDFVVQLTLAGIAAALTVPVVRRARAAGWPDWLALGAGMGAFVGVIALVGIILLVPYLNLVSGSDDLVALFDDFLAGLASWLGSIGLESTGAALLDSIHPTVILAPILGLGSALIGLTILFGIVGIILVYLLADAGPMANRLRALRGPDTQLVPRAADLGSAVGSYVVIRSLLGGVAAVLDVLLLILVGVPFPLVWGVLSFILSFIPNIGFLVSLVPPTILALVMPGGGLGAAAIVVVGYSIINVTIDFIIQPRYAGSRLNLSPLALIVSLFFWGLILGPAGALLAVPLTLAAKAVFEAFPDTRWIGTVLSDGDPTSPVGAA